LSFSAARAPIPALPRLLLSGAWHTLLLFFIVLGGLIVFFFILWEIAAHMCGHRLRTMIAIAVRKGDLASITAKAREYVAEVAAARRP
jgi:hypothetical protein